MATYISVFVGRLDDIGHDGCQVTSQCHQIMKEYQYPAKILGASIHHPKHILDMVQVGIPVVTLPFKSFQQLIQRPLTDKGLELFLAEAKFKPLFKFHQIVFFGFKNQRGSADS